MLGSCSDRDILADLFDERNEAFTRCIASIIADGHASGVKIAVCGEAPSNDPEFASFLVKCGIDPMSLNPDSFAKTLSSVSAAEARNADATKEAAVQVQVMEAVSQPRRVFAA